MTESLTITVPAELTQPGGFPLSTDIPLPDDQPKTDLPPRKAWGRYVYRALCVTSIASIAVASSAWRSYEPTYRCEGGFAFSHSLPAIELDRPSEYLESHIEWIESQPDRIRSDEVLGRAIEEYFAKDASIGQHVPTVDFARAGVSVELDQRFPNIRVFFEDPNPEIAFAYLRAIVCSYLKIFEEEWDQPDLLDLLRMEADQRRNEVEQVVAQIQAIQVEYDRPAIDRQAVQWRLYQDSIDSHVRLVRSVLASADTVETRDSKSSAIEAMIPKLLTLKSVATDALSVLDQRVIDLDKMDTELKRLQGEAVVANGELMKAKRRLDDVIYDPPIRRTIPDVNWGRSPRDPVFFNQRFMLASFFTAIAAVSCVALIAVCWTILRESSSGT